MPSAEFFSWMCFSHASKTGPKASVIKYIPMSRTFWRCTPARPWVGGRGSKTTPDSCSDHGNTEVRARARTSRNGSLQCPSVLDICLINASACFYLSTFFVLFYTPWIFIMIFHKICQIWPLFTHTLGKNSIFLRWKNIIKWRKKCQPLDQKAGFRWSKQGS